MGKIITDILAWVLIIAAVVTMVALGALISGLIIKGAFAVWGSIL